LEHSGHVTDHDLAGVLAELVAREPIFHRPELGTSRTDFEEMTADDFWEVGASGAVYDREVVWDVLEGRYAADEPDEWDTGEFAIRALSDSVYLLTYVLTQGERVTRRATVWRRAGGSWQIVYHQGTVVSGPS
jgi:hypothetical protein